MRKTVLLISLGCLLATTLILSGCSGNRYVGSWKPVPNSTGDNDHMRIDSFNINKDGTFSLKYKDNTRKEVSGTYTMEGEKIVFASAEFRKKVEGTIESDGRLKVTEGERGSAYFLFEIQRVKQWNTFHQKF